MSNQYYDENIRNLTLEDETFDELCQNFNSVMQRLLKTMIDCDSDAGAITVKVEVEMQQQVIPNYDPDIDSETRTIIKPSFDHKVSYSVQVKDEIKGAKHPEMELVWDEENQVYILTPIANTDQMSIFDAEFTEATDENLNTNALPDKNNEAYYKPM